jgi:hypothetical protein
MTDLPENVDLQWIGRTLLGMRDEQTAQRARLDDVEADLKVITGLILRLARDMEQVKDALGRLDARISRLESAPAG